MNNWKVLLNGIITENPTFVLLLGMCPTLATTSSAINGMSNHNRDTENANSAIIVTISPNDFGSKPLDGIKFQRKLEKKAYQIGEGKIPTQLFKDFVENKASNELKNINPIFKGEYKLTNLRNIFPEYISEALIEGIQNFDKKIKGFN